MRGIKSRISKLELNSQKENYPKPDFSILEQYEREKKWKESLSAQEVKEIAEDLQSHPPSVADPDVVELARSLGFKDPSDALPYANGFRQHLLLEFNSLYFQKLSERGELN